MFTWPLSPTKKMPKTSVGAEAEKQAEAFLSQRGLTLLERNFLCRQGEIDLIMEHQNTLVFVEVRYRKSARFGSAAETVTASKQRKLLLAAQHYLTKHPTLQRRPMRFDILGITSTPTNGLDYTWLQNAFDGHAGI